MGTSLVDLSHPCTQFYLWSPRLFRLALPIGSALLSPRSCSQSQPLPCSPCSTRLHHLFNAQPHFIWSLRRFSSFSPYSSLLSAATPPPSTTHSQCLSAHIAGSRLLAMSTWRDTFSPVRSFPNQQIIGTLADQALLSTDTNVKPYKCFTCHMSFARRLVGSFIVYIPRYSVYNSNIFILRLATYYIDTTPFTARTATKIRSQLQTASSPSQLAAHQSPAATAQRQRQSAIRSFPAQDVQAEISNAQYDRHDE